MTRARLRVWAPEAERVEVALGHPETQRLPMARGDGGWWSWDAPTEPDGPLDYAFALDGGSPLPDPRSAWQPHGVDGPSRWVDTGSFTWTDAAWAGPRGGRGTLGGVVYELHLGTFTPEGTLAAAAERLDHLVDLGVDVVELMPVAAFPGRWGWGYDGVLPYAVHDQYGGPEALARFVDGAHARGVGVALDVVYNHLGPSGNRLDRFGPYFTTAHTTPWGSAVNLDQDDSAEVRRWIVDNALRWLRDFHLDALRLDAVHELRDSSPVHVLAQLADEVADLSSELGRPLDLIAESDLNDPCMVTPVADAGRGMDAQWADDVHHALHVALTGERQGYYEDFGGGTTCWPDGGPLSVVAKVLREVFLHDGRWSSFRGTSWGAPVDPAAMPGHRFVAYLQNHDQVGNRAVGDRISATISPGRQAGGAALYLLSPYTAMVFMGEEWATSSPFQFFTDFPDPEIGEAVRSGRRAEFAEHGWAAEDVPDPEDNATRDRSVLPWSELSEAPHARMLAWYQVLVRIRRAEADVADDDLRHVRVETDEEAGWLALHRGAVAVVVDLAGTGTDRGVVPVSGEVLASWSGHAESVADGIRLDPDDVVVLRLAS